MRIQIKRFLLLALLLQLVTVGMQAQLSDPREKFNISAEVDGATNTNYTLRTADGDNPVAGGTMKRDMSVHLISNIQLLRIKTLTLSLSPFYNFSNQRLETEWWTDRLGFELPKTHHHYGAALSVNYQLQAFGKPLTLLGMGTGNFSQYGYEHASGMLGGFLTLKRSRDCYLAVGAIYLLGTAVSWPLYPMVVYMNRFNNRWSLNFMGVNNHLYYHASPTLKYSLGMELQTSKFYFRPQVTGLPTKAELSQLSERVGLFVDWQAMPSLSLNAGMGISVPFYARFRESGHWDNFMNMTNSVKPFVKLKAKFSLFREYGNKSQKQSVK